jgi:hypothetical protein
MLPSSKEIKFRTTSGTFGNNFFRPYGALVVGCQSTPRLAPWAAILRRFAAVEPRFGWGAHFRRG